MPRVIVPLADGCEELEAITVIDLLRRADIAVVTASLNKEKIVHGQQGIDIVADTVLDDVLDDEFDMIVLPGGGVGSQNLANDKRVITILKRMAEAGHYTAAICAAPMVLANAGLLKGRQATSYPGVLAGTEEAHGAVLVQQPVVVDGTVITSVGPGTAMDFALKLIELLADAKRKNCVEHDLRRFVA